MPSGEVHFAGLQFEATQNGVRMRNVVKCEAEHVEGKAGPHQWCPSGQARL